MHKPAGTLTAPRYWPAWAGIALLRGLSALPWPALAGIGALLGTVIYLLHGSRRHVARVNIARCFPELSAAAQSRLVRAHFRALGRGTFATTLAWFASRRRLRRLVRIRDRAHYDRAIADGRGVILLAPHFVGLELAGMALSAERPLVTIFRHPDAPVLRAVMQQRRQRFGTRLVEHNAPLRPLIRSIQAGYPFYYLPDQDAGERSSVYAPFFGIPTATFAVLGRLARLADAVVIPCAPRRRPWGRGYDLFLGPPLAGFPTGDALRDATLMNAEIERAVRAAPAEYFWVHRRFKSRPRGEPDFYARTS